MRPSEYLLAETNAEGVVSLFCKDTHSVKVNGASIGAVPERVGSATLFSIGIKMGEKGMIAVIVFAGSGAYNFFLPVEWKTNADRPEVDLHEQWLPSDPDRLAYFRNNRLEIVIDGVVYSSWINLSDEEKKSVRHVNNESLICQYIDGKITKAEFKEAVGAPAVEADIREELERLKQEVAAKEALIETLQQKLDAKSAELIELCETTNKFFNQVRELEGTVSNITGKVVKLEILLSEKDDQLTKQKNESEKTFNSLNSLINTHSDLKSRTRELYKAVNNQWYKRPSVENGLKALEELLNDPSKR